MTRSWLIALSLAVAGGSAALLLKPPTSLMPSPAPTPTPAQASPNPQVPKPPLALLTSLPLLFGERFALAPPRSAAVARIERTYRLVPIAIADRASLKRQRLLLMAHPRAQPAEALVDLDAWVRGGGRVVLLADPQLVWDSVLPLGDALRPPPDFADTGLLAHWGLRLSDGESGTGRLRATTRHCRIAENGLVARCAVGRGTASVIADADFMMAQGPEDRRRLDLVMTELDRP